MSYKIYIPQNIETLDLKDYAFAIKTENKDTTCFADTITLLLKPKKALIDDLGNESKDGGYDFDFSKKERIALKKALEKMFDDIGISQFIKTGHIEYDDENRIGIEWFSVGNPLELFFQKGCGLTEEDADKVMYGELPCIASESIQKRFNKTIEDIRMYLIKNGLKLITKDIWMLEG
jgi:hypothetical protein